MNSFGTTIAPGRKVLITAALPYANGDLHVGHMAGAYVPADIYARYLRSQEVNVRTVSGSDDHGVAMVLTGMKESLSPAEVSKKYHERQHEALKGLGINFDVYGATSRNEYHVALSQDFFMKIHDKGCFTKKNSQQYYDAKKQQFLPDRFVKGTCGLCGAKNQNGDQCEECGRELDPSTLKDAHSVMSGEPVTLKETVHWFIDLSKFQPQVAQWLEQSVLREHTRSYVKGLLSQGLVERSMTRDLAWGVPVPLADPEAKNKVLYVWFDAPIGYLSNLMQLCKELDGNTEEAASWWNSQSSDVYHFIGEDNTIFHTIIWIAMLSAQGEFSLPKGVIVNHFLNFQKNGGEAEKMSKSRGTALWIKDYLEQGGAPDVMRYCLATILPEESRTIFNPSDIVTKNNAELGGALGNLYQRIIQFTRTKISPEIPLFDRTKMAEIDIAFEAAIADCHAHVTKDMNDFKFRQGILRIMEFARACNKYVDERAPWKSIKTDVEQTKVTLGLIFNALYFIGVVIEPYLPFTAQKIAAMLSLSDEERRWKNASRGIPAGRPLGEPEILFPRLDPK